MRFDHDRFFVRFSHHKPIGKVLLNRTACQAVALQFAGLELSPLLICQIRYDKTIKYVDREPIDISSSGGDGYNFERNSYFEMAESFVGFASLNPALCTVGERSETACRASVFSIACFLRAAGRRDLDRDVTLFDDEADIIVGRRGVRRPGSAEE
jgi:hypothetical protein